MGLPPASPVGAADAGAGVWRMNSSAPRENRAYTAKRPSISFQCVQLKAGCPLANRCIAKARGSRKPNAMPRTPTIELMIPKVISGCDERAAVAMMVAATAPRANPAGTRSSSSSVVLLVNIDSALKATMPKAPKK